ncbi:AraC family transcriptional regulator [Paenibacillus sp. LHD-117]|uniref:AraC family transcriptional regulator n=1 Tax=Paenibacillus sp. LHD-117 TaxID=3071412 RepID=UPI0027DFE95C|nr:AraC family transcriptional regulator [Paenibacillus sp. LHD-117]MDQ6417963.1 AraC family transcriptional regulator [Paenibacillus sp. LHD-117]
MQPIRKPFYLDPVFPLEVVYQGVRYTENELPDHLHDLYELVYIHEGKGTFFIDHALYEKEAGDLFLIPGNTVHRAFPSADEPIVSTAVFFAPSLLQTVSPIDGYDPLRCFEIAHKKKQYKIVLPVPVRERIEATIHAMANELMEKAPGYRQALWLGLQRTLLELYRHPAMKDEASPASGFAPPWMQEALRDIHRDPVRCGSLAALSAKACVSPGHFSRVFKQLTGMNVTDYVNAKRLVRAKELLLATDDTVEAIALLCGFQGMRHFYQIFKSLTGVTPRTYRGRNKPS